MTNIFKREVTIHDKDGKRFDLKISNKGCGGNPYFSISSQSGQGQFNPKTKSQEEFLGIWNMYHLKLSENILQSTYDRLDKIIEELIEEEDEYNERKITIEDLNNEEFISYADENCEGEYEKLMAACLHCGVSWSGLKNVTYNSKFDEWDIEGWEYYIYTDEEADEACKEDIKETAWAFNPDFIISHSKVLDYDKGSYDILKAIQEQCESGNDAILKLIDDEDKFIEDAISSDGRGHFLSWYDGNENEVDINGTTYYLYKQ